MENLEEKIRDVLGDPDKMSSILSIAKNLGVSPGEEPPQETSLPIGPLTELLEMANTADTKQDALVTALLPYLRPEKQKKLRRALRMAKLSQLAEFALKNYADRL